MQRSYQIIDRDRWKRDMHCRIFENSVEPQYCISFELDITEFLRGVPEQGYSFTFAMIYAAASCANETEEFRYRFLDGEVVLYDRSIHHLRILKRVRNYLRSSMSPCRKAWRHTYMRRMRPRRRKRLFYRSPG